MVGTLETADDKSEEGGIRQIIMPFMSWATRATKWLVATRSEIEMLSETLKPISVRLSANSPHEVGVLVIANQNVAVNAFPVLYTPPVTPWELAIPEAADLTARRKASKVGLMTGVKS